MNGMAQSRVATTFQPGPFASGLNACSKFDFGTHEFFKTDAMPATRMLMRRLGGRDEFNLHCWE